MKRNVEINQRIVDRINDYICRPENQINGTVHVYRSIYEDDEFFGVTFDELIEYHRHMQGRYIEGSESSVQVLYFKPIPRTTTIRF